MRLLMRSWQCLAKSYSLVSCLTFFFSLNFGFKKNKSPLIYEDVYVFDNIQVFIPCKKLRT